MKSRILVAAIIAISCSPSKNNGSPATEQSQGKSIDQNVPACVKKMIDQYKSEEKQNPPRQVYSYLYNGKTVYYVTPPCCDFFSDLYDSNCVLIGHPDGGFTGKGDGKLTDFKEMRTNEKLIWRDGRK